MSNRRIILCTHDGDFHADEVLATSILRAIYPNHTQLRTRNESTIVTADIVYDVGGVYDASINRYDHHQRPFTETFASSTKTILSSAGLVYKHFHKDLFRVFGITGNEPYYTNLVLFVYKNYLEGLDANDNGDTRIEPVQFIRTLPTIIRQFNLMGDNQFEEAVEFMQNDFLSYLKSTIFSFKEYYPIIHTSVKNRTSDDFLFLRDGGANQDFIIHEVNRLCPSIKFLIYEKPEGGFRIYGVHVAPYKFKCKAYLKKEWRGLRSEKLQRVTGWSDILFVHGSGFTGGAKTYKCAVNMIEESLKD